MYVYENNIMKSLLFLSVSYYYCDLKLNIMKAFTYQCSMDNLSLLLILK